MIDTLSQESEQFQRIGTLVTHLGEFQNPHNAHIMPIYQSAAFYFPDATTGAKIFQGNEPGYIYTRLGNPNHELLAQKIAALEALPSPVGATTQQASQPVLGLVFSSGMAAISSVLLAIAKSGDKIIAQKAVYGNTFLVLENIAPRLGLEVVWVESLDIGEWEKAFANNPGVVIAYAESPVNPQMRVVDLRDLADLAHCHHALLIVDNTFATPYCQRPLGLGADVVVHSTTKYLIGHGAVVGGAVISRNSDLMKGKIAYYLKYLGAVPSPFDTWLANIGLKTFELRMDRHCANAMLLASYLNKHPAINRVDYPGLESHPDYAITTQQMYPYGGMLSFEVKGGYKAGKKLMNSVKVATLAVSLGNVDTLIQHPASMTHSSVPPTLRQKMGIGAGLVRLSVGIENIEDLIADFDQALQGL